MTTSSSTNDVRPADERLLQLAIPPLRPLVPLWRHSRAMAPWVALLATLPALYAFTHRGFDDVSAWCGLQALQCASARDLVGWLDPWSSDVPVPFPCQPPGMTWLTAVALGALGAEHAWSLDLPAYMGTVALLFSGYALARTIGGHGLGLTAALFLSLNASLLEYAQLPLPHAIALALSVLAATLFVLHCRSGAAAASLRLLGSGLSLGFALLFGGPLAVVMFVVLALHALIWTRWLTLSEGLPAAGDRAPRLVWNMLQSVLLLGATAFATGGWWELMMASRHGSEFWQSWASWLPRGAPELGAGDGAGGWWSSLAHFHRACFPLSALTAWGVWRSLPLPSQGPRNVHRSLLVMWLAVGLSLWSFADPLVHGSLIGERLWEGFTLLPCVLLAAVGLLDVIERRVSSTWAIAVLAAAMADAITGLLLRGGWRPPVLPVLGSWGLPWLECFGMLLAGTVLLYRTLGKWGWDRRLRQERMLQVYAALLVAVMGWWCWIRLDHVERTAPDIAAARAVLHALPHPETCLLVSANARLPPSAAAPPQLLYLLQSQWPVTVFQRVESLDARLPANAIDWRDRTVLVVGWAAQGQPRRPLFDPSLAPPQNVQTLTWRGLDLTIWLQDAAGEI